MDGFYMTRSGTYVITSGSLLSLYEKTADNFALKATLPIILSPNSNKVTMMEDTSMIFVQILGGQMDIYNYDLATNNAIFMCSIMAGGTNQGFLAFDITSTGDLIVLASLDGMLYLYWQANVAYQFADSTAQH